MAYSPIKISELLASNPASTLDGSEAMPAIQGSPSGSVALTVEQIREFVLTSGTPTERRTSDAAFTLTPLSSAPNQLCEGTLTADRAVTLSTTNAYDGAKFKITRTGAGAFNYTVAHNGGTKNISTNEWAEFVYFSALAAWQLVASGSL